jgi:hypothetical protein
LLLALALGIAAPAPPVAASPPASVAQVSAEACVAPNVPRAAGIGSYISGLNNRTRVVQFCVIVMCLALFILMKK